MSTASLTPVCLLQSARAISSAYSAVSNVPAFVQAMKEQDRENSMDGGLTLAQSIIQYLQTRTALVTGLSVLSARLLSYKFSKIEPIVTPVIGNAIGLAGCTIDGMIEIRGLLHCKAFLNDRFFSQAPDVFNQLQNTATCLDPSEKRAARLDFIRIIINGLEPDNALAQKITSVFERVVDQETGPALPMTYEELEKKIEAASWFSKLTIFKETHLTLTLTQQTEIDQRSATKHPQDVQARATYRQQKIDYQATVKTSNLSRRVGESYARQLKSSIDTLLPQLLSEDLAIQTQALFATKKLLENTKIQTEKMRLIHMVGLVSAIVTGISCLIVLCIVCAPAIPLIIGIIGTVIYVARYLLACELMENEGWKFSLISAINRGIISPIKENLIDPVTTRISRIAQTVLDLLHNLPFVSLPVPVPETLLPYPNNSSL